MAQLPLLIALLSALALASLLAPRIRVPQPVLLALVGGALAFVPGVPRTPLDPALILAYFLPPLLYADAFHTSWADFRRWLRPILMLATGLVAFTMLTVGLTAKWFLPELPWAACFLLGAIVSPTDTVAVQAVLERLRVPRRLTAILGGESLVNDATGLVGVQICLAVLLHGAFDAGEVALDFAKVAGGGAAIGLAIGVVFAAANRVVKERTVLLVLSLLAPYLAMHVASALGLSGVLAVVVAGFVVAWRVHTVPPDARVELYTTWDMLVFVLNGLCFLYVGLETPRLLFEMRMHETRHLLVTGLAVSAVVVLSRIVWTFPSAYVPLFLSPRLRAREGGYPSVRGVTIASWCGVRGAVSLAAALTVPATIDGVPFDGRDDVVACTLIVIFVTLLAQGLTLSPLVRLFGMREDEDTAAERRAAREALLAAGIARLDAFCSEHSCPLAVHHYREHMSDELASLRALDAEQQAEARTRLAVSDDVHRAVLVAQSHELLALRDRGAINDQTYLALQLELDKRGVAARG
jgi:CPA1 family monovalent cation:H+ antiporter